MFKINKCLLFLFIICNVVSLRHDNDDDEGLVEHQMVINSHADDYTDAFLFVNSTNFRRLLLSIRNFECIDCKFIDLANITLTRNLSIRISTLFPTFSLKIKVHDSDEVFCQYHSVTFSEMSVYQLTIDDKICKLITIYEKEFIYMPIVVTAIIFVSIAVFYVLFRFLFRRFCKVHYVQVTQTCTESDVTITETNNVTNESTINSHHNEEMNVYRTVCCSKTNATTHFMKPLHQANRLRFIDTFRGICLAMMIFINYGGGGYSMLSHAIWNGLFIGDLIFPSFIFIMGTSIALSMHHKVVKEITQNVNSGEMGRFNKSLIKSILTKIVRRSFLLFFFGLLTSNNSHTTFDDIRIMGVLQRISISYFVCALLEFIYLLLNKFSYHEINCFDEDYNRRLKILNYHFKEIIYYYFQWILMFIFILVWVLVTFLLPVPGCPTGYLGPGGLHNNGQNENCTGGAAGYIDRLLLGRTRLYPFLSYRLMYQAKLEFDPEGLLGCLTSCVLTFFGVTAGHIIIHYKEMHQRIIRFVAYGIIYGSVAAVLCNCSKEEGWVPINKNLWSISFVLAVASICYFIYIFLYLVIDKWLWFSGKPFIFLGKNSIFIYICHIVFGNFFPIQFYVTPTHASLTTLHIYGVVFWSFVAWIMHLKKIIIKI